MGNNCCFNDRNFKPNEGHPLFFFSDERLGKSMGLKKKKFDQSNKENEEKKEILRESRDSHLSLEMESKDKKIHSLVTSYETMIKELNTKLEILTQQNNSKEQELSFSKDQLQSLRSSCAETFKDSIPIDYDVIVPLQSLLQLQQGVTVQNNLTEKHQNCKEAFYLGIIGLAGVGKTFIAKSLIQDEREPSYIQPTQNLNFKFLDDNTYTDPKTHIIVDIPGLNSVIDYLPEQQSNFQELEDNRKALENFYLTFIENVAGIVVYVINRTTKHDQNMLNFFHRNPKPERMLIAIHNIYDVLTEQELDKRVETDIIKPFKALKCEVSFNDQALVGFRSHNILHLVIGRSGKYDEANETVFNFLKYTMEMNKVPVDFEKYGPISALSNFTNTHLKDFISLEQQFTTKFDETCNILKTESEDEYWTLKHVEEAISNIETMSKATVDEFYIPDYKIIKDVEGVTLVFGVPNFDITSMKFTIDANDNNKYVISLEGERNCEAEEDKDAVILKRFDKPTTVIFHDSFSEEVELDTKTIRSNYEQGVLKIKIPFLLKEELEESWDELDL